MGFDGETVKLSTSKLFVVASPSAKKEKRKKRICFVHLKNRKE